MKTIKVVAAMIIAKRPGADGKEEKMVFATQRGYGNYKDWWEFPGGKIEAGETPEEALAREIKEELNATTNVGQFLGTIEYDYPEFHLSMDCFACEVAEGDLVLKEHEAARWLTKKTLRSVNWLPADVTILDKVELLL
jgi:8-oxo-dGTP diphosphatase